MTREDILTVLKNNIAEVLEDFDEADFDQTKSMKDYGATSLDMVEVVSATMRELRVKVRRSELNDIENIEGLIDILHAAVQEKQQA